MADPAQAPAGSPVRADRLALEVELADIASNTAPARLADLDEPTRERLTAKYRAALAALT